ncbi:hypothetical protein K458DRAFT_401511 [Lentithecium fluviatile CBS 122367]|uniref:Uncharacterized protein n=1 Tax=Lentithecium fluviatile CBS 122367 TaxID=1168545 RepID=A0A6G1JD25_9PLEO|nr:hypothetical protein K458DRAFT_401511 [Lentithecium fluviatile CBS 122367]
MAPSPPLPSPSSTPPPPPKQTQPSPLPSPRTLQQNIQHAPPAPILPIQPIRRIHPSVTRLPSPVRPTLDRPLLHIPQKIHTGPVIPPRTHHPHPYPTDLFAREEGDEKGGAEFFYAENMLMVVAWGSPTYPSSPPSYQSRAGGEEGVEEASAGGIDASSTPTRRSAQQDREDGDVYIASPHRAVHKPPQPRTPTPLLTRFRGRPHGVASVYFPGGSGVEMEEGASPPPPTIPVLGWTHDPFAAPSSNLRPGTSATRRRSDGAERGSD